jgi:creatinine amidohydrolase/Fe(II)-dependent formamide hydrolase-like protein
MSAADAGFKNVFLMGDHGDGQNELAAVAKDLDAEWKSRGVRVFYVGDVYNKEKAQAKTYAASHGLPTTDVHADLTIPRADGARRPAPDQVGQIVAEHGRANR